MFIVPKIKVKYISLFAEGVKITAVQKLSIIYVAKVEHNFSSIRNFRINIY